MSVLLPLRSEEEKEIRPLELLCNNTLLLYIDTEKWPPQFYKTTTYSTHRALKFFERERINLGHEVEAVPPIAKQ